MVLRADGEGEEDGPLFLSHLAARVRFGGIWEAQHSQPPFGRR